jgi:hypothetical protein
MTDKEVVAEFGDLREFLTIHTPTFQLREEQGRWIVREAGDNRWNAPLLDENAEPTWMRMPCPNCHQFVRSRNLEKHLNCRRCVTAQIAIGIRDARRHEEDFGDQTPFKRSAIAELAYAAMYLLLRPYDYDDDDITWFAQCIEGASATRRFKLSSPSKFAPILAALRLVRGRWLRGKRCESMDDAELSAGDGAVAALFAAVGNNINRLPIPWLETGDIVDMCHRFSTKVLPPHPPPPRPADPRISIHNPYPGMLFCGSEVDSEDDPSDEEDAYSDDEGEGFVFAPPVTLTETIMCAGFPRDTRKLQYRMRTAPPMKLLTVLQSDRSKTHAELHEDTAKSLVPPQVNIQQVLPNTF